jgi:dTDP-glucose pyrophosphorylase
MKQLEQTGRKVLFICHEGKLMGTLTDGDVRRHLLSGGSINDVVLSAANQRPQMAETRARASELLHAYGYPAVPVVKEGNQLVDVVLAPVLSKIVLPKLGLPVVIMAGGKGTRLDPYTRILPKPLIPVGDFPIIEHIMQRFEDYGCSAFHVVVNYKKQLIKAYFSESSQHYNVTWYDEEQPLGTGGGLHLLKRQMREPFFLTNCDILLRSDYADMLQFHREHGNIITMIGAYKTLTIPYGVVDIENDGVILTMREKPELSFLTNTGMYIVEPQVLEDIPSNTPIGFPEIIELERRKGSKVAVYPVSESEWMDMGQMSELKKMESQLTKGGAFQ